MVYIAACCRFCMGCWRRVASLVRCMQLVQRQLLNMINTTSFRCPRVKAAFSCFHSAVSHGLAPPVYTRRWLYSLTKPRYDVTASTLIGVRASLGALRGFIPIVASPWPLHAVWCISGGSKVVSIHLCFPSDTRDWWWCYAWASTGSVNLHFAWAWSRRILLAVSLYQTWLVVDRTARDIS